jgi:hypothetical protein
MTNIICINEPRRNLNVRQLLNPIFFTPVRCHPDSKRQRKARQRALTLRRVRALKALSPPLREVDPTVYLKRWDYVDGAFKTYAELRADLNRALELTLHGRREA